MKNSWKKSPVRKQIKNSCADRVATFPARSSSKVATLCADLRCYFFKRQRRTVGFKFQIRVGKNRFSVKLFSEIREKYSTGFLLAFSSKQTIFTIKNVLDCFFRTQYTKIIFFLYWFSIYIHIRVVDKNA